MVSLWEENFLCVFIAVNALFENGDEEVQGGRRINDFYVWQFISLS